VVRVKNKKKYVLSIILFLVLFFGTYYFVLRNYPFKELLEAIKHCNKFYIALAFLSVAFYLFFASLYMKRILYHFGKKISWYHAIGYICTEIYFSAITPSSLGGQPVQMIEMNKDKIPYRMNSIIVLLNTLLYKIALIFLAILAFLFYGKLIFSQNIIFSWLVILGFVTTILVIGLFILLIYSKNLIPKIITILLNLLKKLKIIKEEKVLILNQKLNDSIKDYQNCAEFTKKNPFVLLEAFVILLFQRLSLLGISYIIYLAFGLNKIEVLEVIAFQVCITLASDFVPTPGGVAVSEGLLLQVNKYIYGSLLAGAGMLLLRGISFYIVVIFSAIFYMLFHFKKRKGVELI